MMTIYVNDKQILASTFPGGESHISLGETKITANTEILAVLKSAEHILQLLLTVDAVRRIEPTTKISLTIPYFPYARQDRVCAAGEALSVSVIAKLINGAACEKVTIFDPHSDVTPALISNVVVIPQVDLIADSALAAHISENNLTLVAPDAGAEKKTLQLAKRMAAQHPNISAIIASKERDAKTGKIVRTSVQGDVTGLKLLIVDDICDGGRTFIELAKLLKQKGAASVELYVTHGIFSNGLVELQKHISHIHCHHTWLPAASAETEFVNVIGNFPQFGAME